MPYVNHNSKESSSDEAKTTSHLSVNVSRIFSLDANETARFLSLRDAENIRGGQKSLPKVRGMREGPSGRVKRSSE
jgi:hypothetical protein